MDDFYRFPIFLIEIVPWSFIALISRSTRYKCMKLCQINDLIHIFIKMSLFARRKIISSINCPWRMISIHNFINYFRYFPFVFHISSPTYTKCTILWQFKHCIATLLKIYVVARKEMIPACPWAISSLLPNMYYILHDVLYSLVSRVLLYRSLRKFSR